MSMLPDFDTLLMLAYDKFFYALFDLIKIPVYQRNNFLPFLTTSNTSLVDANFKLDGFPDKPSPNWSHLL